MWVFGSTCVCCVTHKLPAPPFHSTLPHFPGLEMFLNAGKVPQRGLIPGEHDVNGSTLKLCSPSSMVVHIVLGLHFLLVKQECHLTHKDVGTK